MDVAEAACLVATNGRYTWKRGNANHDYEASNGIEPTVVKWIKRLPSKGSEA